jgi:hypothetical protein
MNTSVGDEDVLYEDFLDVRTKLTLLFESYRMLYRLYSQVSFVVQTVPPSIVCCTDSTAKYRMLYRQYRQVSFVVQTVPPSIVC